MRADRSVAVLLLLQARGHVTAAEVAAELEVSERTARRDLDALGMAGLPVYSRQGRGGGWALAGRGRTDLSGLTAGEARALFLVAGAADATPEVRAALRKLLRALPEPMRADAEAAAGAVVIDPSGWGRTSRPPSALPHLDALQQAVVSGVQVALDYVSADRTPSSRVVHPLGLAAKGSAWYLVASTEAGLRTFRVDRVRSVSTTGAGVVRPAGFDLRAAWNLVVSEVDQLRAGARVRALLAPGMVGVFRGVLGTRASIGPAVADGHVQVEVRGHSAYSLAGELAGFGAALEVLEPVEVRDHLARIGAELVDRYSSRAPNSPQLATGEHVQDRNEREEAKYPQASL